MKTYVSDEYKKGRLLARGSGFMNMMDKSYQKGLSNDNSILEVDDDSDLLSKWRIYEKIKK